MCEARVFPSGAAALRSSCVHHVFIMCSSCIHHVFIVCSSCVHHVFIMCSSCVYHVFIMYSSCVHHVFIMCSSCVHHVFIMCSSCIQLPLLHKCLDTCDAPAQADRLSEGAKYSAVRTKSQLMAQDMTKVDHLMGQWGNSWVSGTK